MRALVAGSIVLFLLLTGGVRPVAAQSIADQPGATLLLPYFEVDLSHPAGTTTLFTINNSSATAVLAHVTVWSDLAVPVLYFNVYLTGYDMQAIDMRSILNGTLPRTASAGQDQGDALSPKGPFSQDINFASCTGKLPPPPLSATMLAHVRNALTGNASAVFGGLCAGLNHGGPDLVARGFVTVDVVNNCTLSSPSDVGYFGPGGTGDATNQNVLWGDAFLINRAGGRGGGQPLVHIRASSTDPETSVPGQYTFYGRHVGYTAADNREPLSSTFAARYWFNTPPDEGTYLTVWRDPKQFVPPFACGTLPSPFPLNQEGLVAFDEEEHPANLSASLPFPAATQRVKVGGPSLPVPYAFGWLFLNLNTTVPGVPNPPEDPAAAQAWVSWEVRRDGSISTVGLPAVMLDSAMQASHYTPPAP